MNVVAENHADTLGRLGGQSQDALIAAVIGESLRKNFEREQDELPPSLQVLLRSLDGTRSDRNAIT